MKFCPFCGAFLVGGTASFCPECGKAVTSLARTGLAEKRQNKKHTKKKQSLFRATPPPVKPKSNKQRTRGTADENYDGYYDDVPVSDNGQRAADKFEPELVKRIALVAGGALVIVILCVLAMSLL
jgi:uncharacterized Zn finger protein (UPF0148 family)